MFKQEKKNPVLELQKELENEGNKIVLGQVEDDGRVEVNDKLSYKIVEYIYNRGIDSKKKKSTMHKIIFFIFGTALGFGACAIILFALNRLR
jgi:hypothetical protein